MGRLTVLTQTRTTPGRCSQCATPRPRHPLGQTLFLGRFAEEVSGAQGDSLVQATP